MNLSNLASIGILVNKCEGEWLTVSVCLYVSPATNWPRCTPLKAHVAGIGSSFVSTFYSVLNCDACNMLKMQYINKSHFDPIIISHTTKIRLLACQLLWALGGCTSWKMIN